MRLVCVYMKGEAPLLLLLDGRRVLLTHARRPPKRSSLWEKKKRAWNA